MGTPVTADIDKPRAKCAMLSIWMAAVGFAVVLTSFLFSLVAFSVKGVPDVRLAYFAAFILLGAPAAHVLGLALGITAALRRGDARGLGTFGAILNAASIAIGIGIVYTMR